MEPEFLYLNPVGEAGFEPAKAEPPDLQSGPFGHSGIPPVESSSRLSPERNFLVQRRLNRRSLEASGGTRTHNLRFTKPELCQLSYASGRSRLDGERGTIATPRSNASLRSTLNLHDEPGFRKHRIRAVQFGPRMPPPALSQLGECGKELAKSHRRGARSTSFVRWCAAPRGGIRLGFGPRHVWRGRPFTVKLAESTGWCWQPDGL